MATASFGFRARGFLSEHFLRSQYGYDKKLTNSETKFWNTNMRITVDLVTPPPSAEFPRNYHEHFLVRKSSRDFRRITLNTFGKKHSRIFRRITMNTSGKKSLAGFSQHDPENFWLKNPSRDFRRISMNTFG